MCRRTYKHYFYKNIFPNSLKYSGSSKNIILNNGNVKETFFFRNSFVTNDVTAEQWSLFYSLLNKKCVSTGADTMVIVFVFILIYYTDSLLMKSQSLYCKRLYLLVRQLNMWWWVIITKVFQITQSIFMDGPYVIKTFVLGNRKISFRSR